MSTTNPMQSSSPFDRRARQKRDAYEELRRMQQAYAMIQNFDVRPIEMKLRQIRLNRLMGRIRQSLSDLATEKSSELKIKKERARSEAELRQEQIIQARKLGQEFSKLNSFLPRTLPRPKKIKVKDPSKSLNRRIQYGNTVSNIHHGKAPKMRKIKSNRPDPYSQLRVSEKICHPNTMADSNDTEPTEQLQLTKQSQSIGLNKNVVDKELNKFFTDHSDIEKESEKTLSYLEGLLKSKDVTYWDITHIIMREQQRARKVQEFMTRLSNLALEDVPTDTNVSTSTSECFETRTSFIPAKRGSESKEVIVREYRYAVDENNISEKSDTQTYAISEKSDGQTYEIYEKSVPLQQTSSPATILENITITKNQSLILNQETEIAKKIKESNDRFSEIQNALKHVDG